MSYLLIDIGNSFTKYAVYTAKVLAAVHKVRSDSFKEMIASFVLDIPEPLSGIVLVSVADDDLTKSIIDKLSTQFQCSVQQVNTTESALGVKCGYADFTLLGSDRWLAIMAAFQHRIKTQIKPPVMVVDCGTVITVDVIDNSGQHLGGWMMPGSALMYDSLVKKSNGIKRGLDNTTNELTGGNRELGISTQECIEIGNKLSEVGFVEQCFIQTHKKLKEAPLCVFTGGGAKDLIPMLSMSVEYLPNLIFEGLALFTE